MWFKKTKEIEALNSRIFDLERELFESQQFERIASDKLREWVQKHDGLLMDYKKLIKEYDQSLTSPTS